MFLHTSQETGSISKQETLQNSNQLSHSTKQLDCLAATSNGQLKIHCRAATIEVFRVRDVPVRLLHCQTKHHLSDLFNIHSHQSGNRIQETLQSSNKFSHSTKHEIRRILRKCVKFECCRYPN